MIKEMVKSIKNRLRHSGRDEADRTRKQVLDDTGGEILDSTPMQPPLGFQKTPSMFDVMRKMIADRERELAQAGYETAEEADDFDVDDDFDPSSPYEHNFDPPAEPQLLPEVPPVASGKAAEPPSDGPGTPPADPARDGSAAVPKAAPAAPKSA